jgi:hypothetical protein
MRVKIRVKIRLKDTKIKNTKILKQNLDFSHLKRPF